VTWRALRPLDACCFSLYLELMHCDLRRVGESTLGIAVSVVRSVSVVKACIDECSVIMSDMLIMLLVFSAL